MSDDIRKQTDTLKAQEAGAPGTSEDTTATASSERSDPKDSGSGKSGGVLGGLGDVDSFDELKSKITGGKSGGEMLRSMGTVGRIIDESTSDVHAHDVVPMTGLDDTANDKVLDASDLSDNRTLTEMAGSGKDAAFGVMDALAGRGKDVKAGEPLPGSRTDPNTNPDAAKEYK